MEDEMTLTPSQLTAAMRSPMRSLTLHAAAIGAADAAIEQPVTGDGVNVLAQHAESAESALVAARRLRAYLVQLELAAERVITADADHRAQTADSFFEDDKASA